MIPVNGVKPAAIVVGLVLSGSVAAPPAEAQLTAQASVTATAFVQGVAPLTAAGVNDLDFGVVPAGAPTSPSNLSNQAGRFDITGEPSAGVSLSFTLPTVLVGPGGSIPISFAVNDGLLWDPFPTSFTTFDPTALLATTMGAGGTLTVGISGTVSPAAGASTGSYTGTISLTVTYL